MDFLSSPPTLGVRVDLSKLAFHRTFHLDATEKKKGDISTHFLFSTFAIPVLKKITGLQQNQIAQ